MIKKKWMQLFLALVCAFSLAACSGAKEGNNGDSSNSQGISQDEGKTDENQEQNEKPNEDKKDEEKEDKQTQNPIVIESVEDLIVFRTRVLNGETELGAILESDLDMSEVCSPDFGTWDGISSYKGIFDGNGHVIRNLYIADQDEKNVGFFRSIVEGEIKNLGFENVNVSGTFRVGAIVGNLCYSVVENCWVSGTVTGPTVSKVTVGGIVGTCSSGTVKDCINKAEVLCTGEKTYKFRGYAGGIAGSLTGSGAIENCINEGTVTNYGLYTGGIVGNTEPGGSPSITACINKGNVFSASAAGGIVGYSEDLEVDRCGNEGRVEALCYIGGLAAKTEYNVNHYSHFTNCFNHGEIVASEWPEDWAYYGIKNMQVAAGLIAFFDSTEMVNCYNSGKVITQCEQSKHLSGGIIGSMTEPSDADAIIYNCYSNGELNAGLEEWRYGLGEIRIRNIENVHCLEGFLRYTANDAVAAEWELECVHPADAFTDGTILDALQGYVTSGTASYDKLDTLCGWVQGEQGPVFDWE